MSYAARSIVRGSVASATALALLTAGCGDGATEPSIPPGRLVFRTIRGHISGLATARSDGSGRAALLIGQMDRPAWDPAGTSVAFQLANTSGYSDIWVVRTSDGQQRRLMNTPTQDERDASWAPAGDRLAYSVSYAGVSVDERDSVVIANADGTGARAVARGSDPAWGADGRLAFVDRSDVGSGLPAIWVLGIDGTRTRVSTTSPDPVVDGQPAWSSTGRLAWVRRRIVLLPGGGLGPDEWSLMVQPAPGRDAIALFTDTIAISAPAWSPDGTRLVVTASWSGASELWVVSDRGGSRRRVSSSDDCEAPVCGNANASWAP